MDRAIWIFGTNVEGDMAEAESNANGPMFQRSARMRAFSKAMGDDMSLSTAGFASPEIAPVTPTDMDDQSLEDEILAQGY